MKYDLNHNHNQNSWQQFLLLLDAVAFHLNLIPEAGLPAGYQFREAAAEWLYDNYGMRFYYHGTQRPTSRGISHFVADFAVIPDENFTALQLVLA